MSSAGFEPVGDKTGSVACRPTESPKAPILLTTTRRQFYLAHLGMLFVGTSFGGYNVWVGLNNNVPSSDDKEMQFCQQTVFILYRQGGATLLLYPALLVMFRRVHWPENWRDALRITLQGISGIFVNQFLFLLGLARTTPNLAAIFQPLCPVVTVGLAVLLRYERLTWRKSLGVLLGVGGAFLMAGLSIFHGASSDTIGVFLLMVQVFASAVWLLLMKGSYQKYDALVLTAHQYLVSTVCVGLTSISCYREAEVFEQPGVGGWVTWSCLAFSVVVASFANYFIMAWANQHLDATMIGLYGLVQPFSTAVIAYAALRTSVADREYYGMATVTTGLLFVLWDQQRRLRASQVTALLDDNAADADERRALLEGGQSIQGGGEPFTHASDYT